MANLIKTKQIKGGNNGQILTTNSNGNSVWTTVIDNHATDLTYNSGNHELSIDMVDGGPLTVNLGLLGSDVNVTGGTYDINSGEVTFTNNTGGTFTVGGFSSGMTDSYTDGVSLDGTVLKFHNNVEGNDFYTIDISSILDGYKKKDSYATGGSYDASGNQLTFTGNDDFTDFSIDLSALSASLSGDTYITGGTVSYTDDFDDVGSLSLKKNDGSIEGPISGFRDTHVTGGTYSNSNETITLKNNRNNSFDIDLSTLDINDTFVNGGDVVNGALTLNRSIGGDVNINGDIIQSIVGDSPINTSTTNGVTTVSIDSNSLNRATEESSDKNLKPNATTGSGADTGISISNAPAGNVKVEVNGVGYWVGKDSTERTTSDCYFGSSSTSLSPMSSISPGDKLFWNNNSSFDLESDDRVDIFYETL